MENLFEETVERLAQVAGVVPGNLSDEHVRWAIYLTAMELPAARDLLLRAVGAEHDDNLAASVVLRMLERTSEAERAEWVSSLRGGTRDYAHRRVLELSILERAASGNADFGDVNAQQIDGWTDWLQLRVAGAATSPALLDVVAAAGRTRRIRNVAKNRRAQVAG